MNTRTTDTSVQSTIVVDAPIERAFTVFTDGMGSWWPREHHLLKVDVAETVFEPWEGGELYDRGVDGSECHWGRVLAYEPPTGVVFSWDISLQWQLENNRQRTSEVEVRFVAEGSNRTRVELEHRNLDRHGEGWEQMRDAVSSPDGWALGLRGYAARLAG